MYKEREREREMKNWVEQQINICQDKTIYKIILDAYKYLKHNWNKFCSVASIDIDNMNDYELEWNKLELDK